VVAIFVFANTFAIQDSSWAPVAMRELRMANPESYGMPATITSRGAEFHAAVAALLKFVRGVSVRLCRCGQASWLRTLNSPKSPPLAHFSLAVGVAKWVQ
jgi:hypothetical protein